MLLNQLYLHW